MRANLPRKDHFLNARVPFRPDLELIEHIGSGNDAHVFRGRDHRLQIDFACKITPRTNLIGAEDGTNAWRAEIEKANSLPGGIVVHFVDMGEWKDATAGIDCVVLIADFISGENLRDFIKSHEREITMPFIVRFLETMLDFFHSMESAKKSHGDLHAGNILVEDRRASLRGEPYDFRVTDFGVASATSDATRFKDDYFQLAAILRELLEAFEPQAAEPKDQYFFKILNQEFLVRHLVEMDRTLDPIARSPKKLFERLRELDEDYEKFINLPDTKLVTPFDFLSCEQIGDVPSILKALYSNLFLGLSEIEGRNNVVVTGPRGCGKSTVFRNLSLRQRIRVNDDSPASIKHIGVYYFCNDLYFAFSRYQAPANPNALDIPIHFLTATLLAELLEDVSRWGQKFFDDDFQRGNSRAAKKLWDVFELRPPSEPGSMELKVIVAALRKQRRIAAFEHRNAHKTDHQFMRLWGVDVLQRACEVLRDTFPFLRDRPFYFYIDDYSSPKVTKDLQSNLNRLLMQRSACCFFKLATESPVSFVACDIDGKQYVESREFNLLNLGQIYLRDETGRKLQFIEDVFRRRLETAGYPITDLGTLVGTDDDQNFNEDAREIREKGRQQHWSKETLSNLCSGDIHYVINLVRVMFAMPNIEAQIKYGHSVPRIPVEIQDQCIRLEAGKFLNSLRASSADGEQLVAVVSAFGKVANSFLKHRNSKNQGSSPAWQATRIEPHEQLNLSAEGKKIYDELLRYSVFIEDQRGKSRRGDVVPRLFLRRFLIPHFNLTFSNRDSIPVEPAQFELLLCNPSEFERRLRLKQMGDEDPTLNLE